MTQLLEKAFAEISRLPETEQDAFARRILEELASDRQWDKTFAESADFLSTLADEAVEEHRAGKTQPLDPERL